MDEKHLAGDPTLTLPFAFGGSVLRGQLRQSSEDFVVVEDLGYGPSGDGEHEFLTIRKRERNTHDVARDLAKLAGVAQVAVGYAGLKDRNAVTTQHFTVQLPGREAPDWKTLEDDTLQIVDAQRHNRKIRRGSLRGNRFRIVVRQLEGDVDSADLKLRQIAQAGVPNYFGSQRFGRDGQNLLRVDALFAGRGRKPKREQRGLLLSAARGQLFNQVLAARVSQQNWNQAIDGDVLLLSGSMRQFENDPADASIAERVAACDVHPSGPLCGRNSRALMATGSALQIEDNVLQEWSAWIDGLQRFGLDADRRALRLVVDDLSWEWQDDSLTLEFGLTSGAYATAVVRELVTDIVPPASID